MNNKESKKLVVDPEDFNMIVKKITDLEKKFETKPTETVALTSTEENYLFECMATSPLPVTEQNKDSFQLEINMFSDELKVLMKKYNFIKTSAIFVAKKIK